MENYRKELEKYVENESISLGGRYYSGNMYVPSNMINTLWTKLLKKILEDCINHLLNENYILKTKIKNLQTKEEKQNLLELNEEQDEETGVEELLCNICLVNKKTIKLNCGHVCTCISCTKDLLYEESEKILKDNVQCPICRENITSVERIYI